MNSSKGCKETKNLTWPYRVESTPDRRLDPGGSSM